MSGLEEPTAFSTAFLYAVEVQHTCIQEKLHAVIELSDKRALTDTSDILFEIEALASAAWIFARPLVLIASLLHTQKKARRHMAHLESALESETIADTVTLRHAKESIMLRIVRSGNHGGIVHKEWAGPINATHFCPVTHISMRSLESFRSLWSASPELHITLAVVFRSVCYVVNYLHNCLFIAHRNLNLLNILVTEDLEARIRGFQYATPVAPRSVEEAPENGTNLHFSTCLDRFQITFHLLSGLTENELDDCLNHYPRMPMPAVCMRPGDMADGDSYSVARADLSPRDISAKLGDASSSVVWKATTGGACDPGFMAPEEGGEDGCDPFKADIYSMGVIFFTLMTGTRPYENLQDLAFTKLKSCGVQGLITHHGLLNKKISPPLVALMDRMLSIDPALRPSMKSIISQLDTYIPQRRV